MAMERGKAITRVWDDPNWGGMDNSEEVDHYRKERAAAQHVGGKRRNYDPPLRPGPGTEAMTMVVKSLGKKVAKYDQLAREAEEHGYWLEEEAKKPEKEARAKDIEKRMNDHMKVNGKPHLYDGYWRHDAEMLRKNPRKKATSPEVLKAFEKNPNAEEVSKAFREKSYAASRLQRQAQQKQEHRFRQPLLRGKKGGMYYLAKSGKKVYAVKG